MIDRYASEPMTRLWSAERTLELWREVELAALEAQVAQGVAPPGAWTQASAARAPALADVLEEERWTHHDLVAFVNVWTRQLPTAVARWVHRGLTSSDIVDTALGLRLRAATDLILDGVDRLYTALHEHALAHRSTVRVGRTHGMHAAPTVWGLRVADFAMGIDRCRTRLRRARAEVAVMKLSGPVGTYAGLGPEIERRVADQLGLAPVPVSTQVVMRDGIAHWLSCLAVLASVCESIAVEVRHGQRSEVGELTEAFGTGQAGSSAMPHKRNPITAEKVCGLARVVRAYVGPAMESIALWHERDISHSSVERVCLPDAASLTEHIVDSTAALITGLQVDAAQMAQRVEDAGDRLYSHVALTWLQDKGMPREDAYSLIQRCAHRRQGDSVIDGIGSAATKTGYTVSAAEMRQVVDLDLELRWVDSVLDRLPGRHLDRTVRRRSNGPS